MKGEMFTPDQMVGRPPITLAQTGNPLSLPAQSLVNELIRKIGLYHNGTIFAKPEAFMDSLKSCFRNEKDRLIVASTIIEARKAMCWQLIETLEYPFTFHLLFHKNTLPTRPKPEVKIELA